MRIQKEHHGKRIGSTRLAKAMRAPHEIPGDDLANMRLEEMLTRQDIEAWLRRGVEFSDLKFHFVDYFVQSLLKSEDGPELRKTVRDYQVLINAQALGDLFHLQKMPKNRKEVLEGLDGFVLKQAATDHDLYIGIITILGGIAYVRILIGSGFADAPETALKTASVLSGFLVPTDIEAYGPTTLQMTGAFYVYDPTKLNVMAHRTTRDGFAVTTFHYENGGLQLNLGTPAVLNQLSAQTTRAADTRLLTLWLQTPDHMGDLFGTLKESVLQ